MISVYRRGRIYWIRGSVQGVPIPWQSLGTQFKDIAAQLAAKFELEYTTALSTALGPICREFLESARVRVKPSTLQKSMFVFKRFGE